MKGTPLQVDDARLLVLDSVQPMDVTTVHFMESAGFVLAEDIAAEQDIPAFTRAMMDGFAVRFEDAVQASPGNPASLQVIEEVAAGDIPVKSVGAGEAVRIMTGAMIPVGANAVCRFEATQDGFQAAVQTVKIVAPLKHGENIALQGEDIPCGAVILHKGNRIGAAEIAVLATFGRLQVPVYRKPVIGILASGSELIEVSAPLTPGKIRNSNSYMVAALIQQAGGIARIIQPVKDDIAALVAEITANLDHVDMMVTTGGVSVGDYDLIPAVFAALGANSLLHKVMMRPGSPLRFAMRGQIPFFGLSGNPAAAFVHTQLFVLPVMRKMSGQTQAEVRFAKADLCSTLAKTQIKQTRFLRATAFLEAGQVKVKLAIGQSSGMIGSFVGANCLVRLEGVVLPEVNSQVDILLYDEVKLG